MDEYYYADMVILNGRILTIDSEDREVEALAIKRNKIIRVGKNEQMKPLIREGQTIVIDINGKTALPGFCDAHNHQYWTICVDEMLDVSKAECKSIDKIVEKIKKEAEKTEKGDWIFGQGYDDNDESLKNLDRWILDKATKDHYVVLYHKSHHSVVVSSNVLELANITKDTVIEGDGKYIVKDKETGEPNGVIRDDAQELINNVITELDFDECKRLILKYNDEAVKYGITSSHYANLFKTEAMKAYLSLWREKKLKVRTYLMVGEILRKRFLDAGMGHGFGNKILRIGAIKIFSDGSLIGRTAWLSNDYNNDEGNSGYSVYSKPYDDVYAIVKKAVINDFQVNTHAIGDRAIEMIISVYEDVLKEVPRKDPRLRIEHAGILRPDLIERIAKNNFVVVTQPIFIKETGDGYIKAIGKERMRLTYPFKTLMDKGIIVVASSDAPVCSMNIIDGIDTMVNRKTESGNIFIPEECVTIKQALRAYTYNGAYASFEENIKGSLEEGKLADIVVLSEDILSVPKDEISRVNVDTTIINGKIEYSRDSK